MFAGKLEMVAMGKSGVELAFEDALEALADRPLYGFSDMVALMTFFSEETAGPDFRRLAAGMIRANGYRVVGPTTAGARGRIKIGRKFVGVYARNAAEQRAWAGADRELIRRQLKLTAEHVARVTNGGALLFGQGGDETEAAE